jgi:hypothetical protein
LPKSDADQRPQPPPVDKPRNLCKAVVRALVCGTIAVSPHEENVTGMGRDAAGLVAILGTSF